MGNVTTIDLDLAMNVFQVHGVDADGTAVVRQRLTRAYAEVLREAASLLDRHRGVRIIAYSSRFSQRRQVILHANSRPTDRRQFVHAA